MKVKVATLQAKEYKNKRKEQYLPILTDVLNSYHGVYLPKNFWNPILSSHVHFFLSVEELKSERKGKPRRFELFQAVNSDHSLGIKERIKLNFLLFLKLVKKRQLFVNNATPEIFRDGDFAFNDFINSTFANERPNKILNWPLGLVVFYRKKKVRMKLIKIANKVAEGDVFLHNLIVEMPMVYIEYMCFFFKEIASRIPYSNARLHFSIPYHIGVIILLRYLKVKGAQLFTYQHGGFYGELAFHPGYNKDYTYSDGFVTWGWRLNPRDIPFKALKITKFLEDYSAIKNKEIDFTFILPKVMSWNRENIVAKLNLLEMFSKKYQWKTEIRFKLTVGERPPISLASYSALSSADQSLSIGAQCGRSRVVLHQQHPTTNFLECVAVNQPVLAVLTNDQPTPIVKEFYEFYLDQKVFFKSFEDLLYFVIDNDVAAHCATVFESRMHREFKHAFVNTDFD